MDTQTVTPVESNESNFLDCETSVAHCLECRCIFANARQVRKHVNRGSCQRAFCRHDHEHNVIDKNFATHEEATQWVLAQELDRVFIRCTTKDAHSSFRCRHNPHRRRMNLDPIPDPSMNVPASPLKFEASKERYKFCSALMRVYEMWMCLCPSTLETHGSKSAVCMQSEKRFRLRGCLTHSHEIDPCLYRMSQATRERLMSLLESGVPKKVILEKHCHQGHLEYVSGFKPVSYEDLRNLEKVLVKRANGDPLVDDPDDHDQALDHKLDKTLAELNRLAKKLSSSEKQKLLLKIEALNCKVRISVRNLTKTGTGTKRKMLVDPLELPKKSPIKSKRMG
ncbi:uncharacterized protein LOC131888548 isoform X2 [Tigriopus californicus]|uniref:uncharacterized protein LOC131888548 isoform X2 n=1 Tax=Tigriopus californicus TaxID=6832 RepID=UPI0027DA42A4|nr:uncharacterized protein LOC131888548 isoform X2 [Tigriopus californicus]